MTDQPIVVAYGGGLNSAAMLCGFRDRGIVPTLILFADTGGELPRTYDHIEVMSELAEMWWGVPILGIRKTYQGKFETLEANCLRKNMLPSLAYGRKACSMKHKIDPQEMYIYRWMKREKLTRVTHAVGYDAGESHRRHDIQWKEIRKGRFTDQWYPLIEWGWNRDACKAAVLSHGILLPGKSSCFFCPAMKRHEILALKNEHPDYFQRALEIEKNAHTITPGRGLGGANRKWSDEDTKDEERKKLLEWVDEHAPQAIPCGCFDG